MYSDKTEAFDRYVQNGTDRAEKRVQTNIMIKKEIKSLLKQHLPADNLRMVMKNAQDQNNLLSNKLEAANREIAAANQQFQATRPSVKEWETYKQIDSHNSILFER